MLFILIDHTFLVYGIPKSQEIKDFPAQSLLQYLLYSISVCGVDIFILISGWFSIKFSSKRLLSFLFTVFFLLWFLFFSFAILGNWKITLEDIKVSMTFFSGYWFIPAYIALYILSPVLNSFSEKASQRDFLVFLFCFYLFQSYYSWGASFVDYYGGYGIISFLGLYLTARYFRLYPINLTYNHPGKIYILLIGLIGAIATTSMFLFEHASRMLRYDNPLVILSSLCLIIFFSKLKLQNSFVNIVAGSCFAVYLIHFNPHVFFYFKEALRYCAEQTGMRFLVGVVCVYILFFVGAVLIDQGRKILWIFISSAVSKFRAL